MYDCDAVAALFGVTPTTVTLWAKKRLIRSVPRLSRRQPFRFLGSELLRLLGDQINELSGQSETPRERDRRGEVARQRVRAMAEGRSSGRRPLSAD